MLELLWLPFLACLVLTGIHVYLGLHVLARGVIFVDLALAQVAALGITAAFLAGHPIQSEAAYWYALAFTACGAALFSLTRMRRAVIPQEAVIGIVYAVSAAITVLAVDRAPQGSEHIKQLLVRSILTVTPAQVARLAGSVARRLVTGWALGFLVSVLGLWASFAWDLPTGAAVVATFGAMMAGVALVRGGLGLARGVRERGWEALRSVGLVGCCAFGLAGLLLAAVPRMDHHWLNSLEEAVPPIELAFLTRGERQTWHESREALARAQAEVRRLTTLQEDVQWGRAKLTEDQQQRLRQFLASRGEISAGDRFVLRTLREHARERQRFWLGVPFLALGTLGALWLPRGRRKGASA